jgi:hypothetical protein
MRVHHADRVGARGVHRRMDDETRRVDQQVRLLPGRALGVDLHQGARRDLLEKEPIGICQEAMPLAAVFIRVKLSAWMAASGAPLAPSNMVTTDCTFGLKAERPLPGKTVAVLTAIPRAGCEAIQVSTELPVPGALISRRSTSPMPPSPRAAPRRERATRASQRSRRRRSGAWGPHARRMTRFDGIGRTERALVSCGEFPVFVIFRQLNSRSNDLFPGSDRIGNFRVRFCHQLCFSTRCSAEPPRFKISCSFVSGNSARRCSPRIDHSHAQLGSRLRRCSILCNAAPH